MKFIQRLSSALVIFIASLFTAVSTGFIFANSYEVVSLKDVPVITSVSKFEVPHVKDLYDQKVDVGVRLDWASIPSVGARFSLSRAWAGETMYQFANKGQYFFVGADPVHELGDGVIYVTKSWRTFYNPGEVKIGDTVKLTSDSRTLTYRVSEIVPREVDSQHVTPEDKRINLLLAVFDVDSSLVYYINCVLAADEKNI